MISIIIPAKNEEGSVEKLTAEIVAVLNKIKKSYEIIFIDDGSADKTYEKLQNLRKKNKKIKIIKFRGNFGKSAALQAGFQQAKGETVFTMDADLQDNPNEIPKFLKKLDEGYDLVSGWKKTRHDPASKVIPSRIFNQTVNKLTGVGLHDINCGFKAYRKNVVEKLNLYGELYRFIPVFAHKLHYKVTEIEVDHRKRTSGKSKFGIERNVKGFLDLLTIVFITGFIKRPGHFFGGLGLLAFSGGFTIGVYITYLRITTGGVQYRYPLLFLGILLMVIGVQLFTTGLLAEMFINLNPKNNSSDDLIEAKLG